MGEPFGLSGRTVRGQRENCLGSVGGLLGVSERTVRGQ